MYQGRERKGLHYVPKVATTEDIDLVTFYGVNNSNLQMVKALYPKLRIVARGNVMKVLGDEEEMCRFEEHIQAMQDYCSRYNSLNEEAILSIIKGEGVGKTAEGGNPAAICYSISHSQ